MGYYRRFIGEHPFLWILATGALLGALMLPWLTGSAALMDALKLVASEGLRFFHSNMWREPTTRAIVVPSLTIPLALLLHLIASFSRMGRGVAKTCSILAVLLCAGGLGYSYHVLHELGAVASLLTGTSWMGDGMIAAAAAVLFLTLEAYYILAE